MRSPRSPTRKSSSCSMTRRRRSARPTRDSRLGTLRARHRDELFPGQAARLLRRRRRDLHRRRCAGRDPASSIRVHGEGADKYDNVRIGMTGRLDTIQAAVLIEKLKIFPDEIEARKRVAARYAGGACRTSRSCRACPRAMLRYGRNTRSGWRRAGATAAGRGAEGAGHSDRDLLREAAAPADRPTRPFRSPTAACR